jgi:hypothetical protein
MNYTFNLARDKLFAVITLILLGAATGGYAVGHNTQQEETFDIYQYKIDTNPGIAQMMQTVINNPTQENIEAAHYNLGLEGDWAYRQHEERARSYEVYLEACNAVLISLSTPTHPNLQMKIAEMNEKKGLI